MRAKFINEAKISPNRDLFNQFKDVFNNTLTPETWDPFYDLNQELDSLGITLVDFDEHMAAKPPEERKSFMKANMVPELGIRMLGFDPSIGKITLLVDKSFDDKVLKTSRPRLNSLLDRLWSGFGHETIHLQQVDRMKVKQNPTFKSKEDYYGNKQEIMAMAFSFVQEMSEFHTKEDILNMIKNAQYEPGPPKRMPPPPPPGMMPPPGMRPPMFGGRMLRRPPDHPLLGIYKELGGKAYKLFLKYAIQYLDELNEGVEDIFRAKTGEEIVDAIQKQDGGISQYIRYSLTDPASGGVPEKDSITLLQNERLIVRLVNDFQGHFNIDIKFIVNLKTGEYEYEAHGYSDKNSDFYYTNSDADKIEPTFYVNPKEFVSELEDIIINVFDDEESNTEYDFKQNYEIEDEDDED